jgi:hypothetical protein
MAKLMTLPARGSVRHNQKELARFSREFLLLLTDGPIISATW